MRVMLTTYSSRGDVEPMVGLAVPSRALDTVAAAAEECHALVATGVTTAGVCR
jgi:hypothetical protein